MVCIFSRQSYLLQCVASGKPTPVVEVDEGFLQYRTVYSKWTNTLEDGSVQVTALVTNDTSDFIESMQFCCRAYWNNGDTPVDFITDHYYQFNSRDATSLFIEGIADQHYVNNCFYW